jgi:hypothetical protein
MTATFTSALSFPCAISTVQLKKLNTTMQHIVFFEMVKCRQNISSMGILESLLRTGLNHN